MPKYTIASLDLDAIGNEFRTVHGNANSVSAAWPTANKALYIQFSVNERAIATALFTASGTTIGTDSIDLGIYDRTGLRLVSPGGALSASANVIQVQNITDTILDPGYYYMACAMNGTTATLRSWVGVSELLKFTGMYEQTSAYALPAQATFATIATLYVPLFGVLFKGT